MSKANTISAKESKRNLVTQVASSHYFSKSVRLREMFVYVCGQVLDHEVAEIHEQELGSKVFGRPLDYDTSADNTVRVHASMLRKRVDQYFAKEGSTEPVVIEIPRGNYAPIFRERPPQPPEPEPLAPGEALLLAEPVAGGAPWMFWSAAGFATAFAVLSLALFLHIRHSAVPAVLKSQPTVQQFWSTMLQPGRQTDVVIGDASLSLFEEQTGHTVALSEYFDRSYINTAGGRTTGTKLDPDLAKALVLRRQSNYGEIILLGPLSDMAHNLQTDTKVRFARDYSFRELKADNAILLGNISSDPWIEPFQNHQTLRWKYDADNALYYPVDSTATDPLQYNAAAKPDQPREGFATLSLFPNISGTGNVLILSASGGTAVNGALSFLLDETSLASLRKQLGAGTSGPFPYFEALLKVGSRNTLPRAATIVVVRRVHSF